MSIVEQNNENEITWATAVPRVLMVQKLHRADRFVSTGGTPPERIGAAIVDEFADDLRQLGDA